MAAGGCDFGVDIDRQWGQQQLLRAALAAGTTRMMTTIAQSSDGGRMHCRHAKSTDGGDRNRDKDDEDDNDCARRWRREDAMWTHDIERQRGQGWGQGQ